MMNALTAMEELANRPPSFAYPRRVLVQIGPTKFRYLTVRVRKGDGHVMCRRGRLMSAAWATDGLMVFQLESA